MGYQISVIIPTHRRVELLQEAIASVLSQTLIPSEILVVDDANDAATRRAVELADSMSETVSIHYIINAGSPGACGSRNLGAERAVSDVLAFLDDDDIWFPGFTAQTAASLIQHESDFVMSGLIREEPGQPSAYRVMATGLTSSNALDEPGSMTGSNLMIFRRVFKDIGGFDTKVAVFNDWDLFIRLVDAGYRYSVVTEGLAKWRCHPGERIATPSLRRADGLLFFLRRYGHRMPRHVYRNFKTTELGIRRANAVGFISKLRISGSLMREHGIAGVVRRTGARVARIPNFTMRL